MVVNDNTPSRLQARIVEQVLAVGKSMNHEAVTFHQASQGLPHGLIIVNDENDLLRKLCRRLSYHLMTFAVGRKRDYIVH